MTNNGVSIKYGDIAPEAKENFVPSASESQFNTLSQLRQYNLNFPNYANPCELYSVVLDGSAYAFPSNPDGENLGLWSRQISDDNGMFKNRIVLTLTSDGNYSSQGLTFTFDTHNQIYPTHINIHWWRDQVDLGQKDFYPNSAIFVAENKVDHYNKIVITFTSLNMPRNRLKLRVIDYGMGRFFYRKELRNVRLIQEIDPISSQISINTADFTLDSKNDIEYSFQVKQPLSIYFNGELKATTFVKKATRKTKTLWNIQSEDYIGLLDSIPYYGGIYDNAKAVDILTDIFTVAKVPYRIDNGFSQATVTGYIPYTSCREALMQVCFSIQAVADTSNVDYINVYKLNDSVKQIIPLKRIMQGQNFTNEETVTGVEVVSHTYKDIDETVDVFDSSKNGIGQSIFIKFSEPLHDLRITNGTILSSGTNYAVINANTNCVLTGQKYDHTTQTHRKNNPIVFANEIEKVVEIKEATLVSQYNIDDIIQKCYNWLIKTDSTNLKIVESKHIDYGDVGNYVKYGEKRYGSFNYFQKNDVVANNRSVNVREEENMVKYGEKPYGTFNYSGSYNNVIIHDKPVNVGENINAETEYMGIVSGRLIKQSFNLNGNIIIKEAVLK